VGQCGHCHDHRERLHPTAQRGENALGQLDVDAGQGALHTQRQDNDITTTIPRNDNEKWRISSMDLLTNFVDLFLHLDKHLSVVIENFGLWTYLLLFLVIFMETGFVVTPFLPGDSLLFAAGTFAALGSLNVLGLLLLLSAAAILGDTVNYWIGHFIGPKVFHENIRFVKKEHVERTHEFYEKHGGKTIVLARFAPIIRTFAPFVAGVGRMTYGRFITYNVIGGIVWVWLFTLGGFFFGNLQVVKDNFTLVILAIIAISLLPALYEVLKARLKSTEVSVE
jgi:membrane-associated protein